MSRSSGDLLLRLISLVFQHRKVSRHARSGEASLFHAYSDTDVSKPVLNGGEEPGVQPVVLVQHSFQQAQRIVVGNLDKRIKSCCIGAVVSADIDVYMLPFCPSLLAS
jgi:hypothetical protein